MEAEWDTITDMFSVVLVLLYALGLVLYIKFYETQYHEIATQRRRYCLLALLVKSGTLLFISHLCRVREWGADDGSWLAGLGHSAYFFFYVLYLVILHS